MNSLQFELWHECNNNCPFCFNSEEQKRTANEIKIKHLKNTIQQISDPEVIAKYDCLGFMGGEFFQGQLADSQVHDLFFELMSKTTDLYNSGQIKQVWIAATLTIGYQQELYEVLKLFKDLSNVWILSSWDTMGRFNTKTEQNWWSHIHRLIDLGVKVNVTTILTGDLIDKYLNHEFTFNQLSNGKFSWFFKFPSTFIPWTTSGNFEESMRCKKLCNERLPNFFPTRDKYLKFLTLFKQQEPADYLQRLYNIHLRADILVRASNDGHTYESHRYKDRILDVSDQSPMPCGHTFIYAAYIDCNNCTMCDTQHILEFE